MSKISQELRALLYLNEKRDRTTWVNVKELAGVLEVSERQARRYIEDLCLTNNFIIDTRLGRDGGYHLREPLNKGFSVPENIVLAMSIAMKRNEKIETTLSNLSNYVSINAVEGDNLINTDLLNKLELLVKAIENQKEIIFKYPYDLYVEPYKIYITNGTYYLYAVYKDELKKYDVNRIKDIKLLGSFKPSQKVIAELNNKLSRYGIVDNDEPSTLRVKCVDSKTLDIFDKYFEGKGIKDLNNLTYVVVGNSEHELYYPLFRISTKSYEFLDEEFKERYIKYLNNQIRSIRND